MLIYCERLENPWNGRAHEFVSRWRACAKQPHIFGLVLALTMASALIGPRAAAQPYSQGAILTTEAEAAQLPEAAGARGFLPLSVDLGPRFPPVGDQGPIGSCVAFAVGHAALGYLMNEGAGTRLARADLPSPGYLYGLATRALPTCSRVIEKSEPPGSQAVISTAYVFQRSKASALA